jgi:hypothetical protein
MQDYTAKSFFRNSYACRFLLVQRNLPGKIGWGKLGLRRQRQLVRRRCGISVGRCLYDKLHDLTGGFPIRQILQSQTAKRGIRTVVYQIYFSSDRHVGKIDNDVGPLGRGHEQKIQLYGSRQKTLFSTNLPEKELRGIEAIVVHSGRGSHLQNQEAGIASV